MKQIFSVLTLLSLCTLMSGASPRSYQLQAQETVCTDTTSVLCIGNSFTHFYSTAVMLREIAWSNGHWVSVKESSPGGYTFNRHLREQRTLKLIEMRDAYDVTLIQNQSEANAWYAEDPVRFNLIASDAVELCERIREYSPKVRVVLECTWSYPGKNRKYSYYGSYEAFDRMLTKGTEKIAAKCHCGTSPIGKAFAIIRNSNPEIDLLHSDRHHSSKEGAYLKSCVNYLIIFGGDFAEGTSDCGLPAETAAALRKAAKLAVGK